MSRPVQLTFAIVVSTALVLLLLWFLKPTVERKRPNIGPDILVQIKEITPKTVQTTLRTYGIVQPKTQTTLTARVSGEVILVSEQFRTGGNFRKGDVLVKIDPQDYEIAVQQAEASVVEAESRLINEQALAKEALSDWKRSGRTGEPPELALRKPQLRAAESALTAASANLQRAQLNLDRTIVKAPYAGKVETQMVDIGSVVAPGSVLGRVFETTFAEISLPIKNKDLPYLPKPPYEEKSVVVRVQSSLTGAKFEGYLVRMAPSISAESRQATVIARIDNPFEPQDQALLVGDYVTAAIEGLALEDALYVPSANIYQGQYVYLFRDGKVFRTSIETGWFDSEGTIATAGISPGDHLVVTPIGKVISGTAVRVMGEGRETTSKRPNQQRDQQKSGPGKLNAEQRRDGAAAPKKVGAAAQ